MFVLHASIGSYIPDYVVAGGKFQLVSNFTELHIDVLIPAAHSNMLLFSTDSQGVLR